MDSAVAIVQAYLRHNGYLTVTEYPIVEAADNGGFQTATDLDILAFRFAHSCTLHVSVGSDGSGAQCEIETDPALDVRAGTPDMIIGEVKEGRVVLNRAASKPGVVAAALTRFGCCEPAHAVELAQRLVREGQARTRHGHRIRLMAFGSLPPEARSRRFAVVLLGSVVDYLRQHIHRNWSQLQASESKDPGLSILMMLEKAERGRTSPASAQPVRFSKRRSHMNRARINVLALTAGTALAAAALAQSQPASSGQPPAGVDPATHAAHVAQGAGAHVPPAAQPVDNAELVKQLAELRAQIAQLQTALAKGQASGGAPQAAGGMQPAMPSGRMPMGPGMGMKRMGSGSMPPAGGGMSGMPGMAGGGGGMPSGGGGGGMGMMDNMMGGMGGGSGGAPGMSGGGGGGGGSAGGMMDQMMSMGMSRMGGGMSTGGMASALPGFPGASHIYHLGATGFFLDHGSHITLTVEQQKQLGETKEQSLLNQATLQRKIDQAEQELWDLTGSDAPDSSKIEAKVREIEQIKSEQRIEFIRDVGKAAAVLTDEQRKQLTGMAPPAPAPANQPAAMPGMGGGGGMSDM